MQYLCYKLQQRAAKLYQSHKTPYVRQALRSASTFLKVRRKLLKDKLSNLTSTQRPCDYVIEYVESSMMIARIAIVYSRLRALV